MYILIIGLKTGDQIIPNNAIDNNNKLYQSLYGHFLMTERSPCVCVHKLSYL